MGNYLYNGVELPALPEYDKEAYPYAFLWEMTNSGDSFTITNAVLYLLPTLEYEMSEQSGLWCIVLPGDYLTTSAMSDTTGSFAGKEWNALEAGDGNGVAIVNIDWANFDVLNENGTLYLAASDPVPVNPVKLNPALLVQSFFTGQAIRRSRK